MDVVMELLIAKIDALTAKVDLVIAQTDTTTTTTTTTKGKSNKYTVEENQWLFYNFHKNPKEDQTELHNNEEFHKRTRRGIEMQYGKLCAFLKVRPKVDSKNTDQGFEQQFSGNGSTPLWPEELRDLTKLKQFLDDNPNEY